MINYNCLHNCANTFTSFYFVAALGGPFNETISRDVAELCKRGRPFS